MQADFYRNYQIRLARTLFKIEKRGVLVDADKLSKLRHDVSAAIESEILEIETVINAPVALSKESAKAKPGAVILQSPSQVIELAETQGVKLRLKRDKSRTADSATLHMALAESGSPVIDAILKIRELSKLRSVYIDALLHESVMYGSFRSTGTDTGRRSSSANIFGLGTNLQNLPKWSAWAKRFRGCLVARPGKVFIQCDQKSAEDWVINAMIADISGNERGMDELRSSTNRHKKLAGFIFGLPSSQIDKDSIQYYLAKRVRYAGSYGMYSNTMAETLASEGKIVHPSECAILLDRFHMAEPEVRGVFQAWVESELRTKRELATPLGRRRQFFGLRPYSNNNDQFRKGYAMIPQSTVGDNTGLAIIHIEDSAPILLSESHDSVVAEVDDDAATIERAAALMNAAFDREIRFPVSGYTIKIPLEFELGYSLGEMPQCDFSSKDGWMPIWQELRQRQRLLTTSTSSAPQRS